MRRRLQIGFAGLLFPCLLAQVWAASPLPVPDLEKLPNGLEIAWFTGERVPVVDFGVLIRSGYRDDPAGKAGTAEFVAAMLDRGAGGMSEAELGQAVERLGASRYAEASEDSFSVGVHGLSTDADALMGILGKIVTQPEFPAEQFRKERERFLDRWSHVGDYGESLVGLAYHRALAGGTVYGRGGFYTDAEFKAITRDDLMAFHRQHFVPANAVLTVVGHVDRARIRKRVLEAFGAWAPSAAASPAQAAHRTYRDARFAAPPGTVLVIDRPGLNQAQIRLGLRAPALTSPDHYALVVANALLGEYFNSRLNLLIRDQLGLTYGIGSAFAFSRDLAVFTISSSTKTESVGELVKRAVEVLRELRRHPAQEDEIRMAKEYLTGGFPLSTSTLGAVATRWLGGKLFGFGPGYLNEFIPKIKAVTPEAVARAVARDLDPDRLQIVIAGDGAGLRRSLRAAGFESLREVKAEVFK